MEEVSAGAQTFVPDFLSVGELSPKGPHTVDAPMAALGGANKAITNIMANVGDLANISSPYAVGV